MCLEGPGGAEQEDTRKHSLEGQVTGLIPALDFSEPVGHTMPSQSLQCEEEHH